MLCPGVTCLYKLVYLRGEIRKRILNIYVSGEGGGMVFPYISYVGMCGPKGMVIEPFWSEIGYKFN